MKKQLLTLVFLLVGAISIAQSDSLLNNRKWSKEHSFNFSAFGPSLLLSLGYSNSFKIKKHSLSINTGIGGNFYNSKPHKTFIVYAGIQYGYLITKNIRFNGAINYTTMMALYGVFKKEELTIEDYAYNNHITNFPPKFYNSFSFGASFQFFNSKRIRPEVGFNFFLPDNYYFYYMDIIPNFKISFVL